MITELSDVIKKVAELEDEEQRRVAKLLEEEMKWKSTLQNSKDILVNLANEAIAEYKAGKTKQADW